jgi:SAM-dependent methyltransferase
VDLTPEAVDLCRRHHRIPGLEFRVGDAISLPFESETFDAVISVEASHRYLSFDKFISEAVRVLKPGGHLLLADLRWREGEYEELRSSLDHSGLELLEVEDIGPRVIQSLEDYAPFRREMIQAMFPKALHNAAIESAGIPGSSIFRGLVDRSALYTRFRLGKPLAGVAAEWPPAPSEDHHV